MDLQSKLAGKFRLGWIVAGGLTLLTLVEYWIATTVTGNLPYILVIAILKAWLILKYFMHISQVWDEEGEH